MTNIFPKMWRPSFYHQRFSKEWL